MKVNSEELIEILNSAILEYNSQFYDEEDIKKQIPLIDDDGEISEENLSKITKLSVVINTMHLTEGEIVNFNQELQNVLGKMNLKVFMINVLNKKSPIDFSIDFLNALNEDIENLQLRGIDLSDKEPKIFSKFKNLSNGTVLFDNFLLSIRTVPFDIARFVE